MKQAIIAFIYAFWLFLCLVIINHFLSELYNFDINTLFLGDIIVYLGMIWYVICTRDDKK